MGREEKTKSVLILFLLSLIFTGCKSASFNSSEKILELRGNPTTGYTWIYTIGDESIIQVDEDIQYLGKDGMVGAPSLFKYTVRSLKQGNTNLKFEYKRPWEDKKAEEVRFFEVTVKENGKISMTEKKPEEEKLTYKSVSMTEGIKLMSKDSDFILLDVRRPDEFAAGHIPGAVQLTNESMTKENTAEVLPDKAQKIYVYCRSGRRSKEASQKLVDWGYSNVVEIGGIIDYEGAIEK